MEEVFALYRRVFELQAIVAGQHYSFDDPLSRAEDVPEEWMADYTEWAHEDSAAEWLERAPPGSVCLASRLGGVGGGLERAFRRYWSDCAVTFMHGPLDTFVSMGAYRCSEPFTDDETTLMSLLHPQLSAAFATQSALRAIAAPAGETLEGALRYFEGHVFVGLPAGEVIWSDRARDLWQELLGEPGSPAFWTRIEQVLRAVVERFLADPFATRSARVYRGVRAEIASVPAEPGETRRFVLLFVRETAASTPSDSPLLLLLGERQRTVALAAARGRSLKLIASDLGISLETARSHLRAAYRRLGVESRAELCRLLGLD